MEAPRPEVLVASTLYLISGWAFDPAPCACRVKAIVAHLEQLMGTADIDPVIRATAIQLHESWHRVAKRLNDSSPPPATGETLH